MATQTFEQWKSGRSYAHTLGADACGYETDAGWHYEAGFIVDCARRPMVNDGGQPCAFYVPLPTMDAGFTTLEDAEAFLWDEWCGPEING